MTTASAEFDPKDPLASFVATWRRVLLEPRAFFEGLPAGGLEPPLLFALICLAIGGFGFMIFGGRHQGISGLAADRHPAPLRRRGDRFAGSHSSSSTGTATTRRRFVARYSTAVAVVIGIPVIKYFAALYGIYLVILGLPARTPSIPCARC